MNAEQINGLIRTLLTAGGPIAGLLALYGLPADKVTAWLSIATIVLPPIFSFLWSLHEKRTDAQLARVEAMPGVKIGVDTSESSPAPQAAIDAANNPTRTKIESVTA